MKGTNPVHIEQPFEGDDKVYYVNGGRCSGKVDKTLNELVNYTNKLQQENQELKKQLEEVEEMHKDMARYALDNEAKIDMLNNQQKEFINYINAYIELLKDKPDLVEEGQKDILEEILSKYRKIIGVSNEKV